MNEELRCYTFTHFIVSSIQQGIQSGHASMELSNKYMLEEGWINGMAEQVAEWIKDHKTIICLNGGNSAGLHDLSQFLNDEDNPFPYVEFYEDEQTAEGLMTSISTVLPARIFDGAARLRRQKYDSQISVTWDHLQEELRISWVDEVEEEAHTDTYSRWERDLMNRLNKMQLAR